MKSFIIKTYFNLINIVLESFSGFYTICIKFIQVEVLNLLKLGKSWRCKNDLESPFSSLGHDRGFLCVTELSSPVSQHGSLCRMVPRLQEVAR